MTLAQHTSRAASACPPSSISPFPLSCEQEHPNSPVRFRPVGPQVAVVRPAQPLHPCVQACEMEDAHCIQQVSVDQVLRAIDDLISTEKQTQNNLL